MRHLVTPLLLLLLATSAQANPPVASYLFPAGGQRGTTVQLKVGGLFLNKRCNFALAGPGITATKEITSIPTLWFEGPQLPLPDSQRQEDYPRDMAGSVTIAPDAPLGPRRGYVWTAEGVAPGLKFVVGDLPEIIEQEIDGDPIAVPVKFPVTINGRIFPRQNVDLWSVDLKKGTTITASVMAARIGSPLDARLELLDPEGRVLVENDDADGRDPRLRFTAPTDGVYSIRISDSHNNGSQAHVYRLTITDGPWVDSIFPLGGKRGQTVKVTPTGHALPPTPIEVRIPESDSPAWLPLLVAGKMTNPVLFEGDDLPEVLPGDAPLSAPAVLNGRIDKPGDVQAWKLQLTKGKGVVLEMHSARLSSRLQGTLALKDATGKVVAQGQGEVPFTFAPPADGLYTLEVADRFKGRGGPGFGYRVRLTEVVPDLRIKLGAEWLNVQRGTPAKMPVQVERLGGFVEPIALTIEGLPPGVTFAPATIAKGAGNGEIVFTIAPEAAIGATPLKIVATGPAGSRSVPLLFAVTLPVPFKVVADYEMRWSARGSTHKRGYRIERNGYDGPLEIRMADKQARHLQGVVGPVLTVPPGQNAFEYAVQLAPGMEIGRTCRVCVMATGIVKDKGQEYEVSYSRSEQNDQIVTVVETGRLGIELPRPAIEAKPGASVEVPFTLTRGKELTSPVKVCLVVPPHIRGVKAEAITLLPERDRGTLTVTFDAGMIGPFNLPLLLRASHESRDGTTLAEAPLEIVPEPRR
jgi:hypothetical protein